MTYNFLSLKGYNKAIHKQMKYFLHFCCLFVIQKKKVKQNEKACDQKFYKQINQQILAIILYKDQQPGVKKISHWRGWVKLVFQKLSCQSDIVGQVGQGGNLQCWPG